MIAYSDSRFFVLHLNVVVGFVLNLWSKYVHLLIMFLGVNLLCLLYLSHGLRGYLAEKRLRKMEHQIVNQSSSNEV